MRPVHYIDGTSRHLARAFLTSERRGKRSLHEEKEGRGEGGGEGGEKEGW